MAEEGQKFPSFDLTAVTAKDQGEFDHHQIKLDDYQGQRLVIFFYPKDDTPGCTVEAKEFSQAKEDFTALNCSILGISRDNQKSHQKFIKKFDLTIPLACDEDTSLMDGLGIWIEKSMYGRKYMGAERTTYLLNEHGNIQTIWSKVSVPDHVKLVLDEVKKYA